MNTLKTLRVIAAWTGHPLEAVRSWARRGKITPKACDVKTHAHLYDMLDVPTELIRDTPTTERDF